MFEGSRTCYAPLWEGKGLMLTAVADPAIPVIHTDPAKLQQVLYNFLSNAIKFSPPGAGVTLTADLVEGEPAAAGAPGPATA